MLLYILVCLQSFRHWIGKNVCPPKKERKKNFCEDVFDILNVDMSLSLQSLIVVSHLKRRLRCCNRVRTIFQESGSWSLLLTRSRLWMLSTLALPPSPPIFLMDASRSGGGRCRTSRAGLQLLPPLLLFLEHDTLATWLDVLRCKTFLFDLANQMTPGGRKDRVKFIKNCQPGGYVYKRFI